MRDAQRELLECLADPANIIRRLGFEPETFQKEILYSQDRITLIGAARGSGKTLALAALAVWFALLQKDDIPVFAPSIRNAGETIRYAREIIQCLPIRPGIVRENQTLIELANGSRIIALPIGDDAQDSFSGARGFHSKSGCILDETAYMSRDLITSAVLPVIAPHKGARIIAASTPSGMAQGNWFYQTWISGKARTIHAPSRMIKHLDQAFLEELGSGMTENQRRREFDAEFIEAEGAAFRFSDLENLKSDQEGVML